MGDSYLWLAVIGVIAVGGYLWYQSTMGKINNAINQPGFVDKLAGALSPDMNKRGIVWNPNIKRWVDAKTGKVLSQGEQTARYGCKTGCTGMAVKLPNGRPNPERAICLKLCKQYGP